jgi:hypothetical protein
LLEDLFTVLDRLGRHRNRRNATFYRAGAGSRRQVRRSPPRLFVRRLIGIDAALDCGGAVLRPDVCFAAAAVPRTGAVAVRFAIDRRLNAKHRSSRLSGSGMQHVETGLAVAMLVAPAPPRRPHSCAATSNETITKARELGLALKADDQHHA